MGGGERMGGREDGRGKDGRGERGGSLNSSAPPSMNTVYMIV